MKRILIVTVFMLFMSLIKATDTLTVREVFNFEVGDTFDYISTSFDLVYHPSGNPFDTTYNRYVITGKNTSAGSDTITYNRVRMYPSLLADTIILYHANNIDSSLFCVNCSIKIGISNWDSIYNSNFPDTWPQGIGEFRYKKIEQGLGKTVSRYLFKVPDQTNNNQITLIKATYDSLIYWKKGQKSGGNPYYKFVTGINDIPEDSFVSLYSNPTTDQLHISIPSYLTHSNLQITDLFGSTVYSSPIDENNTTISIAHLAAGIYTWHMISNNGIAKTGKIVKQ